MPTVRPRRSIGRICLRGHCPARVETSAGTICRVTASNSAGDADSASDAVTVSSAAAGAEGPQGPQGPAGPAGPQGPPGAATTVTVRGTKAKKR